MERGAKLVVLIAEFVILIITIAGCSSLSHRHMVAGVLVVVILARVPLAATAIAAIVAAIPETPKRFSNKYTSREVYILLLAIRCVMFPKFFSSSLSDKIRVRGSVDRTSDP